MVALVVGLALHATVHGTTPQQAARGPAAPAAVLLYDAGVNGVSAAAAACVTHELKALDKGIRILSGQEVADAFFPWLEDTSDGFDPDAMLPVLLSRMGHERADALGLRFVIFLVSGDSGSRLQGPMECGAVAPYTGCLGAARLRRQSSLRATLWDFQDSAMADALHGRGQSTDTVVGVGVPLWLPGGRSTKTLACEDLARALNRVLHADPDHQLRRAEPPLAIRAPAYRSTAAAGSNGGSGGAVPRACMALHARRSTPGQVDGSAAAHSAESASATYAVPELESLARGAPPSLRIQWIEQDAERFEIGSSAPESAHAGVLTIDDEQLSLAPDGDVADDLRVPLWAISSVDVFAPDRPWIVLSTDGPCRVVLRASPGNSSIGAARTRALGVAIRKRFATPPPTTFQTP